MNTEIFNLRYYSAQQNNWFQMPARIHIKQSSFQGIVGFKLIKHSQNRDRFVMHFQRYFSYFFSVYRTKYFWFVSFMEKCERIHGVEVKGSLEWYA